MPECMNLDDLSVDAQDMLDAAKKLDAEIDILNTQREYLREKAKAMEFRKAANIKQALHCERYLETLYKQLPQEYQW